MQIFARRTIIKTLAALPALTLRAAPGPRLLVVDGNSLSDSPSPYYTGQRTAWPVWFMRDGHAARLGITATVNHAVGTWDVRDCAMRAPELIDPLASLGDAWLVLWDGTNALARIGNPLATWQAHADYLQARRGAGFARMFVGTIASRELSVPYTLEQRHTFNDLVRLNAANVGAQVLDFAAMPGLGGDADFQNKATFYDGIHPTDDCSRQIAAFVADALTLKPRLMFPAVTNG